MGQTGQRAERGAGGSGLEDALHLLEERAGGQDAVGAEEAVDVLQLLLPQQQRAGLLHGVGAVVGVGGVVQRVDEERLLEGAAGALATAGEAAVGWACAPILAEGNVAMAQQLETQW